jgi:dephospho-CoA kinase
MPTQKLVIGTAGMPGAGKSIALTTAKQQGYDIIIMGNVVREEAAKRQINPTPENLGRIMLELREKEGPRVIAKRCIPKIQSTTQQKILIDGIRSLDETEEFKVHYSTFTLLALHASPETRFQRLYNRKRSDDPRSLVVFHDRDMRELSVGLGNTIALADYMIVNEESFETAKKGVKEVLERAEQKWLKSQ